MVRTAVMEAEAAGVRGRHSGAALATKWQDHFTRTAPNPESLSTISRSRVRERVALAPRDDVADATLLLRFARILDRVEGLEFDVVQLAVHLLDLANIDVLDDVARLRIDRDRAARALPGQALHRREQRVAVGLAAVLLQGLVDQVDAVVTADRHEAGTAAIGLFIGGDERLVLLRRMRRRIDVGGDGAEHGVAHVLEQVVVGDIARPDHPDAALVEAALGILLHEVAALAGRHEHEDRVRLGVLHALQERREVRIGERHLDLFDDLAAAGGEVLLERRQGVIARRVVGGQRCDLLDAVLRRPVADDGRGLRQGEAGAHDVGRLLGDDRGAGRHHHFRDLALGRQRRRSERGRRDAEACDHIDLVVDDQFLRQPLGVVGQRGVVLEDDLDLLAGDGVAVLLHVELDGIVDLLAGRRLAAGHRHDQPDLEGVLGGSRTRANPGGDRTEQHETRNSIVHLPSSHLRDLERGACDTSSGFSGDPRAIYGVLTSAARSNSYSNWE
ncbi:hypothetical protein BRAS3843_370020 [Bradyrhizobium sp. STM 3843]|nr:hypothetical protein BRAS3843_370020 [Bradyrhizobium sp. STM 3843]